MEISVFLYVTAQEHRSHCWAALAPEKGGDPRSGEDRRAVSSDAPAQYQKNSISYRSHSQ